MATWTRLGTGTAPSTTDADLVGEYLLDNATAPADFDPAAVTSVRLQWTITGSGFSDDSWDDNAGAALVTSGGTEIAQFPGGGPTGLQNTSEANDVTDSTGIPTGLSTAEWESARVRGDGTAIPNEWVTWVKNKGPDGSTLAVSALTVTITYTPASTDRRAQVSFAELEIPNAPLPDWIRGWSRKIETASVTSTIVDKPTGVAENDIMYAFNIHESATMISDTPPSGWVAVGTNPHAFGGGNAHVYKKTAGASEPTTYTFTYDPGNQMVTYIIAIKGDTYAIDAEILSVVEDVDSDGGYEQTLTGISTSAVGLLAITGNDPASATNPNYGSTSGMTKRDETSDVYLGAMAAWFTEAISGITSTTEVLTNANTIGNTMPILLVSIAPSATDRRGQVSFTEFEIPNAPRRGQVSFTELEIPNAARRGQVSFTELELPNGPRRGQISFTEFEIPTAPRRAWISFTELEIPDAARRAQVSWTELEIPERDRIAQISWSEFEIGTAPRRAQISFAELEMPETLRGAQLSFAEFEIGDAPRRAQVSFVEIEMPDAARRAQVSFTEVEIPNAARKGMVSWTEFEIPIAARRAQISFTELEVPNAPRRAQISMAFLEIPELLAGETPRLRTQLRMGE